MRGDRILNVDGWAADEFMPLPGGQRAHRVRFWVAADDETLAYRLSAQPVDGRTIGMEVEHRRDDGSWCGGYIAEDTPLGRRYGVKATGHQVVSLQPLHIEPSLACRACPSHGFVHNGKWVGATD